MCCAAALVCRVDCRTNARLWTMQEMPLPNAHLFLCAGTLPASWGSRWVFPALRYLGLQHSAISGEILLPAQYNSLLNEA